MTDNLFLTGHEKWCLSGAIRDVVTVGDRSVTVSEQICLDNIAQSNKKIVCDSMNCCLTIARFREID